MINMSRSLRGRTFVRLAALIVLGMAGGALSAAPRVLAPVPLPAGTHAAAGCYDAEGTLHLVLARDGGCRYARRKSAGESIEDISSIPSQGTPAFVGDRAPKIAVHRTGKLFVLWQTEKGLCLSASVDQGRTWNPIPADTVAGRSGIDVPAMAMSPDGRLYVVWVDDRDPASPDDAIAKHLYLAASDDGGKTFSAPRRITTDAARACPCCTPAIVAGAGGEVRIAYRTSVADTKETALLTSTDAGRTFQVRVLSNHRWALQGCPMAGPSLAASGKNVAVTWTSDGNMFTSSSPDGGLTFTASERLGRGRFNRAAANADGQTLRIWDEGAQTGIWWGDQARPAPRLELRPAGVLLAAPDQRFELLVLDRSSAPAMPHGHRGRH